MEKEGKYPEKRIYKTLLLVLKVIPMLLALSAMLNMFFDFFGLNSYIFSYIGGISVLPILFIYLAVVVIGPTTNGDEFLNTVVHEVHHLAVAIADNLGIDLEGETPAYLSGDTTRDLADVICHLGCSMCN